MTRSPPRNIKPQKALPGEPQAGSPPAAGIAEKLKPKNKHKTGGYKMGMSLTVRPSQKDYSKFGLLWIFAPNRAHEIFTGTKQDCYDIQRKINTDMKTVQIELKGITNPAYWVRGENYGGVLEYNMDFETEREALNAAGDYLTRAYI